LPWQGIDINIVINPVLDCFGITTPRNDIKKEI